MEKIRKIKEDDIEKISVLYDRKAYKSELELKWLFRDPANAKKYNGFVALNEKNEIIGVISYITSYYVQGKRRVKGVTPMSWKINKNHKGFAGVLLFKTALTQGDFSIAIRGSEMAQNLYPLFKYKKITKSSVFIKILNLKDYYRSLKGEGLLKRILKVGIFFPSLFLKPSKSSLYKKDVELMPYTGDNFVEENTADGVFKKVIKKDYIDWLLDCPKLNTYAFIIKKGSDHIGMCVLYIREINKFKRGRIVYLPFLGFNKKLWISVIDKCIAFLKREGCCFISALALHDMSYVGFRGSGFIKSNRYNKPIYIKDNENILQEIDLQNWHLQYTEGDKAYRDI